MQFFGQIKSTDWKGEDLQRDQMLELKVTQIFQQVLEKKPKQSFLKN